MTTIPEKRSETDLIAGFLVVVFALAAFRGAENAPIMAGVAVILAVVVLAFCVTYRRKPVPRLAITEREIVCGRTDQPGMRITRDETGPLQFRMGFKRSGWFLVLVDAPSPQAISMIGFSMVEVRRACIEHGWSFV
jgi:hypothetical protein